MPAVGQPCTNHKVKAYIYGDEPHKRSHFHVVNGDEWDVSICIETGEVLEGDAPPKDLKEAEVWRVKNIDVLRGKWREYNGPED